MKARPYVMGGGIWAFSDLPEPLSRHATSGYRVWGIVTPNGSVAHRLVPSKGFSRERLRNNESEQRM